MSKFQGKVQQALETGRQQRQARRQQREAEQEMRYQLCDQIYDILIHTNDEEMTSRIVGIIAESVSLEDLESYIKYPEILYAIVNIIKDHLADVPFVRYVAVDEQEMRYHLCDQIYDILIQTNDEKMTSRITGIIEESLSIPYEDVVSFLKNPEELNAVVNDIKAHLAKIPIVEEIEEPMDDVEEIVPRKMMILKPIGAYQNPMDYYISLIQWCRQCAHYDNCPEVLQEAIFELMGNEGIYKKVFADPWKMLRFIKDFVNRHQYYVMCAGGEEQYADCMVDHIAKNGRFTIMHKASRILGHWGLSKGLRKNVYNILRNHEKVDHKQIREMYLDPRKFAEWLKSHIPKSYTVEKVDAAMGRHGFYYY